MADRDPDGSVRAPAEVDVVVVGAGFAGMYLLHKLRGLGFSVRVIEAGVPDFNLDSDRGYAWHCWDWDRSSLACIPDITPVPGRNLFR